MLWARTTAQLASNSNNMEYWQHQTAEKPLFPDTIWSKPETANSSGKLLIIGGSTGNMSNVAKAYALAESAGVGTISLLVPESLRKITKQIPYIQYADSNPSGGFAKSALAELLDASQQKDGVLLSGDLGKNSETVILLESFLEKYGGMIIISPQSIESFADGCSQLLLRENTILCLNQSQLRNLCIEIKSEHAITSQMDKPKMAKILHELSQTFQISVMVETKDEVWVAKNGLVADCDKTNYCSAKSGVWAIQQPEKLFQTLVSSIV